MRKNSFPIGLFARFGLILVLAAALFSAAGSAKAWGLQASATSGADIVVLYKLDPRFTGGAYMGDRWVSPPLYDIVIPEGVPYTLEARAERVDENGLRDLVDAHWLPSNSEILSISPALDRQFKISILHTGRSTLTVTSAGITEILYVDVMEYTNASVRLRISKTAFPDGITQICVACQKIFLPISLR